MSALAALLVRDMRIAVRVGGGALMGVLFFLVVVTLMPFALGPDLALLKRIGPAILWLAALLASLLGARPAVRRRPRGRLARSHPDEPRAARTRGRGQGPCALAHHRPAAGHRRAADRAVAQSRCAGRSRVGADASGRHAGADLHRPDRRRHCGDAAPRRAAARRDRAAADGAGPDLRRRRGQCGRRPGRCRSARRSRSCAR